MAFDFRRPHPNFMRRVFEVTMQRGKGPLSAESGLDEASNFPTSTNSELMVRAAAAICYCLRGEPAGHLQTGTPSGDVGRAIGLSRW